VTRPDPPLPRIAPRELSAGNESALALLSRVRGQAGRPSNVFRTLVHNEEFFRRFLSYGGYLMYQSDLPSALREIVILRVAAHCGSEYEWRQHVPLAQACGVDQSQITALRDVQQLPPLSSWDDLTIAALTAVDQLIVTHNVDDDVWSDLAESLRPPQIIDFLFLLGHFISVALFLNATRVAADPWLEDKP
jgi:4-carboxymuconolactone decarboxylase